jgi:FtsP/CotA-like multicopper oxidase with cupredoxin domain
MISRKFIHLLFSLLMIASLVGGNINVSAAPTSPTDESKVPHYFGPYPNWANSPLAMPDAQVVITGNGTGAAATATVGANGAITGITVTNPGRGYSNAKVDITGSGTGATASATIVKKGSVVQVLVNTPGAGYTAPAVTFGSGGSGGGAAATAFGGVDQVTLISGGSGYTFPTVEFDLPDAPNGVQAKGHAVMDAGGTITSVVVDSPGSGYSQAPGVAVLNGTQFDPIAGATPAEATATLSIQEIAVDSFGANYNQVPGVTISDLTGSGIGATATAVLDNGIISAITVNKPGSGYITPGGIHKFVDGLPGLGPSGVNNLGQYISVAVPDTTTFPGTDYYVIAVVQHREQMHSDLPPTLLREYVQLSTSVVPGAQVPLLTSLLDGTTTPTLMPDGVTQAIGVDNPHFLGPLIVAQKDRAVRITFYNLLPTGVAGDLFMPTDSTVMGSGMGPTGAMDPMDEGTVMDGVRNPLCSEYPKGAECFKDNRATLHLHGGITPWISDGTPHQWITPANENTPWPQGVSVEAVPDMGNVPGVPDCSAANDGCMTFYYTNQQSARLMFYHDHAWGITRLNVYAGEAAGYLITDPTEQKLIADGTIPADQIPLVIQDRTFVPDANQLALQDPTWDASRWGTKGNFWYHHVYMPAQNPGDPSGMSAYGRWMYGPWFWPPATPPHGPIANPYYNPNCNLDDPASWQYQIDPFCEPAQIPGTPNISVGMEQFNDTPIVNGTAYPTTTVDPKAYRLRILNAANDRFWNLQWYVADSTGTEVALNAAEVAAAQVDPNVFPTPDTTLSPVGPSWIQIGTEGGFLPAPVVVPNQPITWITDPTRFDVGNVDKHSLLLAPAERADVIVDFSKFAGQTLILYNDAPAAFPARVASYDYYTGGPDLWPAGAPTTLPGYGPNTRTIMQVKVAANAPAAAFNLAALQAAFRHHADGSGVFESGQHPIIVGQAAYNSAYGTNFVSGGWCNSPTNPSTRCDGYVRISEQGGDLFGFNTLLNPNDKKQIVLQPKAIHDEMNAAAFDEFGRMTANLGLEAVPATPALQNIILYPFVNPSTELIDATNLPKGDVNVTPIGLADDGTQIWKITHNGVDTHPIHWHLYDVQVLNRVTWDNIIIPPDATELGWKDTLRVSPLEDTIVALRPIIPTLPFELPNSVRPLNPMTPLGSQMGFNNIDQHGNPTAPIVNQLVNFGWEYVYHCHILSHEEMDMMRPVSVALPPNAPDGLVFNAGVLTWNDNSINETAFVIQRDDGTGWVDLATIDQPLHQPDPADPLNKGPRSYTDTTFDPNKTYQYRVVALNRIGLGGAFMSLTVQSVSDPVVYDSSNPPAAPILTAAYQAGPQILLNWSNVANETGYVVEKSTDGVSFSPLATLGVDITTYTDAAVILDNVYYYRVTASNVAGDTLSNVATVTTPPVAPTNLTAVYQDRLQALLNWTDNATYEDGFIIERIEGDITTIVATVGANPGTGPMTYTDTSVAFDGQYVYQVSAFNASGPSALSNLSAAVAAPPLAPTGLTASYQSGVLLTWFDNSLAETGFSVQRCEGVGCTNFLEIMALGPLDTGNGVGNVSFLDANVMPNITYSYYVAAVNASGPSNPSNTVSITLPNFPLSPTLGTVTNQNRKITVTWGSVSSVNGYTIQWSTDMNFTTIAGIGSAKASATSFTTPNLTGGMTYYFRIRADSNANGSSLWANYPPYTLP